MSLININIDGYVTEGLYQEVRDQVETSQANEIHVKINTRGGLTSEAKMIRGLLLAERSKGKKVVTYALAYCDSAGVLIFGAGEDRVISEWNESFVIHKVRLQIERAEITADTAVEIFEELNKSDSEIASLYNKDFGISMEEALALMAQEESITPERLLALGIATEISEIPYKNVTQTVFANVMKCDGFCFDKKLAYLNSYRIKDDFMREVNRVKELIYERYISTSKGYNRSDLPQIPENQVERFINYFESLYGESEVVRTKYKNTSIKPTQIDFNSEKIIDKVKQKHYINRVFILSQDHYLLDGHHDWAASFEESEGLELNVAVIPIKINELVKRANRLKITNKLNFNIKSTNRKFVNMIKLDYKKINSTEIKGAFDTVAFTRLNLQSSVTSADFLTEKAYKKFNEYVGDSSNENASFPAHAVVNLEDGNSVFVFTENENILKCRALILDGGVPTNATLPDGQYNKADGGFINVKGGIIVNMGDDMEEDEKEKEEEQKIKKEKNKEGKEKEEDLTNELKDYNELQEQINAFQQKFTSIENALGALLETNSGGAQAVKTNNTKPGVDLDKKVNQTEGEGSLKDQVEKLNLELDKFKNQVTGGSVKRAGSAGNGKAKMLPFPKLNIMLDPDHENTEDNFSINWKPSFTEKGMAIFTRQYNLALGRMRRAIEGKTERRYLGAKVNANSITFGSSNNYDGQQMLEILSIPLLAGRSVQDGLWTIKQGIKKEMRVTKSDVSVTLQDPSAVFTPDTSDIVFDYSQKWHPVVMEIQKQTKFDDLRESYHEELIEAGAMKDYKNREVLNWWLSRTLERTAIAMDSLYWRGKDGTVLNTTYSFSENYNGILGKALDSVMGASVKKTSVPEGTLTCTGISNAAEAVVTVSDTTNLQAGDYVTIDGVAAGTMGTLLNGKDFQITDKINGTTFRINVDTTGVVAWVDNGCTVKFINESNVIPVMKRLLNLMDEEIRMADDFFIAVPPHIALAYKFAVANQDTGGGGEYYKKDQPLDFLGNTMKEVGYMYKNSVWANRVENQILGLDLLADSQTARVIDEGETTQNDFATMKLRMATDVNWVHGEKVTLVSTRV